MRSWKKLISEKIYLNKHREKPSEKPSEKHLMKHPGKFNRLLDGLMRSKLTVAAAMLFIAAGVGILLFIAVLPNVTKEEQKTSEAKEAAAAEALAEQDYETAEKGYLDAYNAYASFNKKYSWFTKKLETDKVADGYIEAVKAEIAASIGNSDMDSAFAKMTEADSELEKINQKDKETALSDAVFQANCSRIDELQNSNDMSGCIKVLDAAMEYYKNDSARANSLIDGFIDSVRKTIIASINRRDTDSAYAKMKDSETELQNLDQKTKGDSLREDIFQVNCSKISNLQNSGDQTGAFRMLDAALEYYEGDSTKIDLLNKYYDKGLDSFISSAEEAADKKGSDNNGDPAIESLQASIDTLGTIKNEKINQTVQTLNDYKNKIAADIADTDAALENLYQKMTVGDYDSLYDIISSETSGLYNNHYYYQDGRFYSSSIEGTGMYCEKSSFYLGDISNGSRNGQGVQFYFTTGYYKYSVINGTWKDNCLQGMASVYYKVYSTSNGCPGKMSGTLNENGYWDGAFTLTIYLDGNAENYYGEAVNGTYNTLGMDDGNYIFAKSKDGSKWWWLKNKDSLSNNRPSDILKVTGLMQ